MPELQQFPLIAADGSRGTIFRRSRFLDRDERSLVRMEDGREFEVAASEIRVLPDGTFLLDDAADAGDVPRGRRESAVDGSEDRQAKEDSRPGFEGAVQIDEPLYAEDAGIERVPVNRLIDREPQIRQEGDVTIVPVVEEVLVLEKRLLLKEEIHIRRTRNQVREPKRIVVNGSEVRVVDWKGNDPGS